MQIHAVLLVVEPPVKTALKLLRDPRLSEGCQNVCAGHPVVRDSTRMPEAIGRMDRTNWRNFTNFAGSIRFGSGR